MDRALFNVMVPIMLILYIIELKILEIGSA